MIDYIDIPRHEDPQLAVEECMSSGVAIYETDVSAAELQQGFAAAKSNASEGMAGNVIDYAICRETLPVLQRIEEPLGRFSLDWDARRVTYHLHSIGASIEEHVDFEGRLRGMSALMPIAHGSEFATYLYGSIVPVSRGKYFSGDVMLLRQGYGELRPVRHGGFVLPKPEDYTYSQKRLFLGIDYRPITDKPVSGNSSSNRFDDARIEGVRDDLVRGGVVY